MRESSGKIRVHLQKVMECRLKFKVTSESFLEWFLKTILLKEQRLKPSDLIFENNLKTMEFDKQFMRWDPL